MQPTVNLGVIRLSDLKGEAQTGPVRQKLEITKKYGQLGVAAEDITWAEDLDVGAFHIPPLKRPHLRQAFNDLPPGSTVVFYRLDRFVRRVFPDFSDMVTFAADKRLSMHSATETLDLSGPVGMTAATMIAFIAQMESENISARVKNTQAYFRQVGRWRGGPLPYGYRPTRVEGKPGWWLEQDPETSPVLRQIVADILAGHSLNSIAIRLNREGVLPPFDRNRAIQDPPKPRLCQCGHDEHAGPCEKTHKCHHRKRVGNRNLKLHEYDECSEPCPAYRPRAWVRESLYQILRSPAICGYAVEDKTRIVRDDEGLPVSFAPGVIDFDTYTQLQRRLDERASKRTRTLSESLLLNVAYCDCGAPLYLGSVTHQLKSGERTFEYYRTTRAKLGPCKGTLSIRADKLDALVQRELLKTLGDRKVLRKETSSQRRGDLEAERRSVAAQIVDLTQDMFLRGRPRENHDVLMAELQTRHAELTEALAAEADPEPVLVETGEVFRDKWESMSTLERRLWLMDAGVQVVAVRGRRPPLKFLSLPPMKRSLIFSNDGDIWAVIYLGNFGELLRRASDLAITVPGTSS